MVKILSTFSDIKLTDKIGYIKNLSGHICNVHLEGEGRVISITSDHLEPVTPRKGDKVADTNESVIKLSIIKLFI